MTVLNFAEEFTRLVIRYTKTSPNNNLTENVPLTNQEVIFAVRNVLITILEINDLGDNSSLTKTPASGITVITPTAPIGQKIKQKNNEDECRSESVIKDPDVSDFNSPLQTNEKETKNSFAEALQDKKKFISRSSPAINISSVGRSNTFTCEDNKDMKTTNQDINDDVFINVMISNNILLELLNAAQDSAENVVKNLNSLKKKIISQTKHKRRTSSYNFSSTIKEPRIQRSITAFPGTPTSSRMFITGRADDTDRRKSIGGVSCGTRKLSESTAVGRTMSPFNVSTNKLSPNSLTRPTKNPKYAHVQSTIPKPIKQAGKRKAQ